MEKKSINSFNFLQFLLQIYLYKSIIGHIIVLFEDIRSKIK
jgi:hypothetical protein